MLVRELAPGRGFEDESPAPNIQRKTASAMPTHTAVNGLWAGAAAVWTEPVWAEPDWAVRVRSTNNEDAGRSRSGAMDGS
jgi:hypothetical protein